MHKTIQQFIDGIDEVSNYTLQGPSQFSEVTKLEFVKHFLYKVFKYTDADGKLSDPVMYRDFFMPNTVAIFVNEIKHETLVIIISEDNKLVSATIGETK